MSLYLPISFLVLQFVILVFVPSVADPAAYIYMVIAPLLAAAAGAFGNLWQELILNRRNEMYRDSMLAFNLAAVPITFLLASDWRLKGRRFVRAIDALVALALGCSYFQYTWTMINYHVKVVSAPAGYAGLRLLRSDRAVQRRSLRLGRREEVICLESIARHRSAEQVPLHFIAPQRPQ
jgi:hypothetical protein